jgi:hypothetical protein
MGKLDVSGLAHAAEPLPPNLLRALFTRVVPYGKLFRGMVKDAEDIDILHVGPRFLIRVDGFCKTMTLASFVH